MKDESMGDIWKSFVARAWTRGMRRLVDETWLDELAKRTAKYLADSMPRRRHYCGVLWVGMGETTAAYPYGTDALDPSATDPPAKLVIESQLFVETWGQFMQEGSGGDVKLQVIAQRPVREGSVLVAYGPTFIGDVCVAQTQVGCSAADAGGAHWTLGHSPMWLLPRVERGTTVSCVYRMVA